MQALQKHPPLNALSLIESRPSAGGIADAGGSGPARRLPEMSKYSIKVKLCQLGRVPAGRQTAGAAQQQRRRRRQQHDAARCMRAQGRAVSAHALQTQLEDLALGAHDCQLQAWPPACEPVARSTKSHDAGWQRGAEGPAEVVRVQPDGQPRDRTRGGEARPVTEQAACASQQHAPSRPPSATLHPLLAGPGQAKGGSS